MHTGLRSSGLAYMGKLYCYEDRYDELNFDVVLHISESY